MVTGLFPPGRPQPRHRAERAGRDLEASHARCSLAIGDVCPACHPVEYATRRAQHRRA